MAVCICHEGWTGSRCHMQGQSLHFETAKTVYFLTSLSFCLCSLSLFCGGKREELTHNSHADIFQQPIPLTGASGKNGGSVLWPVTEDGACASGSAWTSWRAGQWATLSATELTSSTMSVFYKNVPVSIFLNGRNGMIVRIYLHSPVYLFHQQSARGFLDERNLSYWPTWIFPPSRTFHMT